MSRQFAVYHREWTSQVAGALPHLSKPQAAVLALFSLGMVFARSCAVTAVAAHLALALDRPPNTIRQQLREFCYEAKAKTGSHRREVEVEPCFLPLLGWIVSRWEGAQLALVLDATTLADRFAVLVVSIVYRGCAIPVAWVVLPAGEKHAWRREWLRMLRLLHRAVPPSFQVLVLADRGLYARWLFRRIVRLGWHPFLRINRRGTFCPTCPTCPTFRPVDETRFWPLAAFAPKVGSAWAGQGTAFKTAECHLDCTLLARWEAGHEDPWLILTDLDPTVCDVAWYGLRIWIERGFKSIKRGGWQWQSTRMTDPERAERLWLVVALSTLWLVSVGGEAETAEPESLCEVLDHTLPSQHRTRRVTRLRQVGVFHQGLICLSLAMLNHEPLPFGRFQPEPWPRSQPLPNLATLDQPPTSQNPTSKETYP